MEVLGRFPTKSEAKNHALSEDIPVWLSMNEEVTLSRSVMSAQRALSSWISNDYY